MLYNIEIDHDLPRPSTTAIKQPQVDRELKRVRIGKTEDGEDVWIAYVSIGKGESSALRQTATEDKWKEQGSLSANRIAFEWDPVLSMAEEGWRAESSVQMTQMCWYIYDTLFLGGIDHLTAAGKKDDNRDDMAIDEQIDEEGGEKDERKRLAYSEEGRKGKKPKLESESAGHMSSSKRSDMHFHHGNLKHHATHDEATSKRTAPPATHHETLVEKSGRIFDAGYKLFCDHRKEPSPARMLELAEMVFREQRGLEPPPLDVIRQLRSLEKESGGWVPWDTSAHLRMWVLTSGQWSRWQDHEQKVAQVISEGHAIAKELAAIIENPPKSGQLKYALPLQELPGREDLLEALERLQYFTLICARYSV